MLNEVDASGAIKREAARFRVYGLNARGEAVVELTADNAEIRWTAQLANRKAARYQFQPALAIPDAAMAKPSELHNKDVTGERRKGLAFTPGHVVAPVHSARTGRAETPLASGKPEAIPSLP